MKTIAMQRKFADWLSKSSKKTSMRPQIREMRLKVTMTMKKRGRVKIKRWTHLTLITKVIVTARKNQSRSPARKPSVPKSKMKREFVLRKLR